MSRFRWNRQNKSHQRSSISSPIGRPYVTCQVWIAVTYLLSCTVSDICQIIGPIFALDRGCLTLTQSSRVNLYIREGEFGRNNTLVQSTSRYPEALGVNHECDRQTDRLAHSIRCTSLQCAAITLPNSAANYSTQKMQQEKQKCNAWVKMFMEINYRLCIYGLYGAIQMLLLLLLLWIAITKQKSLWQIWR